MDGDHDDGVTEAATVTAAPAVATGDREVIVIEGDRELVALSG